LSTISKNIKRGPEGVRSLKITFNLVHAFSTLLPFNTPS
jgi:hypothetical protein